MRITVIIRDEAPLRYCNEPCGHRRVTIELTPTQAEALKLRREDEHYSTAFVEDGR